MKLIIKAILLVFLIVLSNCENIRKAKTNERTVAPTSQASTTNQKASNSGIKTNKAPFNADSAISLAKEIAVQVVNKNNMDDNTFASTIGACFGQLRNKKSSVTSNLVSFWNDMNLAYNSNSYTNNSFTANIANPLGSVNITSGNGSNINCGTFLGSVKDPNPASNVINILGKSDYFAGFVFNGQERKPFITGIVGTRRKLLPKGAFHILNGQPAPQ